MNEELCSLPRSVYGTSLKIITWPGFDEKLKFNEESQIMKNSVITFITILKQEGHFTI